MDGRRAESVDRWQITNPLHPKRGGWTGGRWKRRESEGLGDHETVERIKRERRSSEKETYRKLGEGEKEYTKSTECFMKMGFVWLHCITLHKHTRPQHRCNHPASERMHMWRVCRCWDDSSDWPRIELPILIHLKRGDLSTLMSTWWNGNWPGSGVKAGRIGVDVNPW